MCICSIILLLYVCVVDKCYIHVIYICVYKHVYLYVANMYDVIEVCTLYRHGEYMSWKKYVGLHCADVHIDVYNAHGISMWSVHVWCKRVCGTCYREKAAATPTADSHQRAVLRSAQRTCLIPQGGERKSRWVLLSDLPLTGRFLRKLHRLAWQFSSTGSSLAVTPPLHNLVRGSFAQMGSTFLKSRVGGANCRSSGLLCVELAGC